MLGNQLEKVQVDLEALVGLSEINFPEMTTGQGRTERQECVAAAVNARREAIGRLCSHLEKNNLGDQFSISPESLNGTLGTLVIHASDVVITELQKLRQK
jgi:hypothetical protein